VAEVPPTAAPAVQDSPRRTVSVFSISTAGGPPPRFRQRVPVTPRRTGQTPRRSQPLGHPVRAPAPRRLDTDPLGAADVSGGVLAVRPSTSPRSRQSGTYSGGRSSSSSSTGRTSPQSFPLASPGSASGPSGPIFRGPAASPQHPRPQGCLVCRYSRTRYCASAPTRGLSARALRAVCCRERDSAGNTYGSEHQTVTMERPLLCARRARG